MLPDMFFSKEKELRQKIEQGEYPFLGLFSENFPIQTRVFIQKIIKGHDQSDHPVDRCIRGLVKYPALFSVYLVFHLMEGFGRNGHFEVYPLLAEAIGTSIPPNKTPNIWSAFRNACLSLGLSVSSRHSGSHFMVEEYLRQAGYPFNYIEQLTDKMIKFAADAGLPDDDDQNSIDLWRQGLLERLHPPFSVVARTAIEMDEGGYYVRLFCRLYNRQLDGSETELTRRISNALSSQAIVIRKISIPFVMFRNYQIGVLLPAAPGQERCWQIESGDFSTLYSSLDDERFISIPHNLPRAVMIKELHSSTKPWYYQLWEDDRDNRLVIFNLPSGRLVQTAKLSDGRINLKPGDYALLLRFTPDQDTDIEHISQIPALYLKSLTLLPSQTVIISRGPVHLAITADAAPIIRWLGEPVQAVRGEMIYPDAQLQIAISIPEEIIRATDKALNLYFSTHQLGDTIEIPLHFTNVTQQIVPVGDYLKKWQPGVTRLLAEVRRADSRRPLVRSAIMLWHGLLHVDRRVLFRCSALPRNIVEKECENIKIKADQNTITYRDEGNRFFKFIFMDGDRRLAFSWSVPGIFMSIEKPDSTGQLTETPVRIGSTVTSSQMTRDVLKIFASENAILKLGEWVLPVDFERLGGKRIPLAGLCNYTRIDNNSLEFLRGSGNESIRLLNIVSPHVVRSFLTEQGMRIHKAHFVAFDEVKAFRIRAHNLIDDDDFFIEISVDQINAEGDVRFPFGPKAKMFLSDNNQFTFYIAAPVFLDTDFG